MPNDPKIAFEVWDIAPDDWSEAERGVRRRLRRHAGLGQAGRRGLRRRHAVPEAQEHRPQRGRPCPADAVAKAKAVVGCRQRAHHRRRFGRRRARSRGAQGRGRGAGRQAGCASATPRRTTTARSALPRWATSTASSPSRPWTSTWRSSSTCCCPNWAWTKAASSWTPPRAPSATASSTRTRCSSATVWPPSRRTTRRCRCPSSPPSARRPGRRRRRRSTEAELPGTGDRETRGLMWEAITAVTLLLAGANVVVLRHPESAKLVRKTVASLGRVSGKESRERWQKARRETRTAIAPSRSTRPPWRCSRSRTRWASRPCSPAPIPSPSVRPGMKAPAARSATWARAASSARTRTRRAASAAPRWVPWLPVTTCAPAPAGRPPTPTTAARSPTPCSRSAGVRPRTTGSRTR